MNVEELEVIAPDNDETPIEVIEVTDALPKVPDMLKVDEAEVETEAEAKVADSDDETLVVLEVADKADAEPVKVEASEATEVVDDDAITPDDIAREAVLDEINEIADSADKSLNVRVPFIDVRATKNAVIGKFLSLNKHLLSKKYHSLVDCDIALNGDMYNAMLDNVKVNVSALTKAQADKAMARAVGFVDSGKGYYADVNF